MVPSYVCLGRRRVAPCAWRPRSDSSLAVRRRGAILPLVLALGCAHGHLTVPVSQMGPAKPPIGAVRVTASEALPPDRLERYRHFGGDELIARVVRERLVAEGIWQDGAPNEVVVRVEQFRLRSAGTAFWVGVFAGIDMLEGTLTIGPGGTDGEPIGFKYSGAEDEYMKFSAAARFRSMAGALADDVVAYLTPPAAY
jgi:hypothetical protein